MSKLPKPSGIQAQSLRNPNSKPGGTSVITFGKTAGRVKEQGTDPFRRWTYQLLDGKGDTDILIISVYQCCKKTTKEIGMTAFHQQQLVLSELLIE